jgi:WD40 repeat protein
VACSPSDTQLFLSVSEDGCAKLWDRRQNLVVQTIYATKLHGVGLRSIAWQPGGSGRIALGDARGQIIVVEIGESSCDIMTEYGVHSEAVNRLAFSPHQ